MNVVPAVPPGRGRRDREQAVAPAGEEQMDALRAAAASATTALPEIALQGIVPITDLTEIGLTGSELMGVGLEAVVSTATDPVKTDPVKTDPVKNAPVTTASVPTVQGPIDRKPTVRRQSQGQTMPVQTVFLPVDRAINDSERIGLQPSAAGMLKGHDPMTGAVPVVPMTSVPVEMIAPPRGTATAVFVRTVHLIDVVQEMNGVSHPRDSVSTRHRSMLIFPLHVE